MDPYQTEKKMSPIFPAEGEGEEDEPLPDAEGGGKGRFFHEKPGRKVPPMRPKEKKGVGQHGLLTEIFPTFVPGSDMGTACSAEKGKKKNSVIAVI